MHYVTRISYRMQKHIFGHIFGVMCLSTLFVESAPVPPKHEKLCVNISWVGRTGTHYMIRRSHQMQKHKFNIMCPDALFMETVPGPPDLEK
jgi:hypothetical protein